MKTAIVTFTGFYFPKSPGAKCVIKKYTMTLQKGAAPDVEKTDDSWLHVYNPGAILRFTFNAQYRPIGIAFSRYSRGPAVHLANHPSGGWTPFSGLKLNPRSLEVTDTIRPARPGTKRKTWTFEFSIIIQRQSDGAIGIIDPYIENEN